MSDCGHPPKATRTANTPRFCGQYSRSDKYLPGRWTTQILHFVDDAGNQRDLVAHRLILPRLSHPCLSVAAIWSGGDLHLIPQVPVIAQELPGFNLREESARSFPLRAYVDATAPSRQTKSTGRTDDATTSALGRSLPSARAVAAAGSSPSASQRSTSRRRSSARSTERKSVRVEVRREGVPGRLVEEEIVALDQHDPVRGADHPGAGPRQVEGAVEDRDDDVAVAGADAREVAREAVDVEGFRRSLSRRQAALGENGVVEVIAVHRHQRRLAPAARPSSAASSASARVDLPAPGGPAMAKTKRARPSARARISEARASRFTPPSPPPAAPSRRS